MHTHLPWLAAAAKASTMLLRLLDGGNHRNGPFLESRWKGARFPYVLASSRKSGDVVEKSVAIVTTWGDEGPGLSPDTKVAALAAAADEIVAPLVTRIVGIASAPLTRTENAAGESSLGNLIADAQRVVTNVRFSFMNPGGIRNDLNAGEVTWGELFAIQPFGNDLVSMDLTGAQIDTLLEQQWSGLPT